MDIASFASTLRRHGLAVFTTRDLELLVAQDRALRSLQLHQWARKGWVARLKKGVYELRYPEPQAVPDLFVANRLYEPSYVSLETALSHHQLIPETAANVTSVTTKPTRRISNAYGLFTYASVQARAFCGMALAKVQGFQVRLAEPEKALVDQAYSLMRRGEALDAGRDRLDRGRLRKLDRAKLDAYCRAFGASGARLKERVHALL